jgi:hypothetical protein
LVERYSPDGRLSVVDLTDPTTAALVAIDAAERAGGDHALYGGLLLAAYGEPRETRDVDLAVASLGANRLREALEDLGFPTEPNFEGVVFGGLVLDRITLLGGDGDLGLNTIDLVRPRSARFARVALDRAPTAPLRGRIVRVLSPEDFVLFKVLSTRDRDLSDAASVLRRSGEKLDRRLMDEEIGLLAEDLPEIEVQERYSRLW